MKNTNNMIIKRIIEETKNISPDDFDFERAIGKYRSKIENPKVFFEESTQFIRDQKDDNEAYKIFFFNQMLLRRNKEYNEMAENISEFRGRFLDIPSFLFLESLYMNAKGFENASQARKWMKNSIEALEKIPHNLGAKHSVCVSFCNVYEIFEEAREKLRKEYYSIVCEYIDDVITVKEERQELWNPKFYSTKARLLIVEEKYNEAKILINKAIQEEDSSQKDYSLRIGEYQKILTYIDMQKSMNEFRSTTNGLSKKFEGMEWKGISVIAIFATVATFAAGSVTLIKSFTPHDASRIVAIAFVSSTIMLVSVLSLLTTSKSKLLLGGILFIIFAIALILLLVLPWS